MQDKEGIEKRKEIFSEFDIDKNGTIELREIGNIAAKLGEPLKQGELSKIIEQLDLNKDGKISFAEFNFWWMNGKKGKFGLIVALKAKAMELVDATKKKFSSANISLEGHKGSQKPDKLDLQLSFGEKCENPISIRFTFCIQGTQQKLLNAKIKKLVPEVNTNTKGFLIRLRSSNPAQAKIAFDLLINDIFTSQQFPLQVQNIENNPLFKFKTMVTEKQLLIFFRTGQALDEVAAPVTSTASQVFESLGQNFYSYTNVELSLNSSVSNILQSNLVQNLLKGFNCKLYQETNQSALGKVRKLAEKSQNNFQAFGNLLTLIRSSKFHLKIKSPDDLDKFLNKLGINEVIQGLPAIQQILEGLSPEIAKIKSTNPLLQLIYKFSHFGFRHIENNIQLFILGGEAGTGRLTLSCEGAGKIHSILFNEV